MFDLIFLSSSLCLYRAVSFDQPQSLLSRYLRVQEIVEIS